MVILDMSLSYYTNTGTEQVPLNSTATMETKEKERNCNRITFTADK